MWCETHEELLKGKNMITRWREKEWRDDDDDDEGGVGRWINSERAYVWKRIAIDQKRVGQSWLRPADDS